MDRFFTLPLSLMIAILACLRAFFDAIFGSKNVESIRFHQCQNESKMRRNIEHKAAEMVRAAELLERQCAHDIKRFQTRIFRIEKLQIIGYDQVEILLTDIAGGSHLWHAGIDEYETLICDESMPLTLVNVIRKTANPMSTLSDLTCLIQSEIANSILLLHDENRRRLFSIPTMVNVSPLQQLGLPK